MRTPDWQSEDGAIALYCGDCLTILPELEAGSVDAVVTDPPYGHSNNSDDLIHRREAALGRLPSGATPPQGRPIANDGPEANDILRASLPLWDRLLKPGCCCCCGGGGGGPDPQFARWSLWLDEVFDFKQMVVWDKGPMGMGWHYRRSYETVLVGQKPGAACKWHDTTSAVENIIRPGHRGIRKIIPSATDHPTPKPVELAEHFIGLHSTFGDVVLDPFMGHGWVGEAAVKNGRRFIGVELNEGYFQVVVKRIEKALREKSEQLWPDPPAKEVQGKMFEEAKP
jgi:site-specific DNA-methyltransferase (adenine-specific)